MYSQAVRLCFVVVVVLAVICAANPVGTPKHLTENEPHHSKDVFKDVAKILRDENNAAKKDTPVSRKQSSLEPAVKFRHKKHRSRSHRDQVMQMDAPSADQSNGGPKKRVPRQWRPEWSAPQPTPYNMYSYSQVPQTQGYQYYTAHPYYNYRYPGYTNWYAGQMPNYKAYNLPPESEWKTTVHEAPDVEWTAHIAFPNMEPIIITNKNYSSSTSKVKVIINKSEPEGGRSVGTRHVPVPGPRPVDPNSRTTNQKSHYPSLVSTENKKNKNKQQAFEPISWTAQIDYPNTPPVVYRGGSPQTNYPQRPVTQYVNPPVLTSGQGYYYPYNPQPQLQPQWPAPAYNTMPWVVAPPYQVLGSPSSTNQWPIVQVSYPDVNANNVPQSAVPSQPRDVPYFTTQYPSYETKPAVKPKTNTIIDDDNDDDDDDDDDDDATSDEQKGNDDEKKEADKEGSEESEESGKEETPEPDNEAEDYEDATAAPDSDEEEDVETTTKKSLFSWG